MALVENLAKQRRFKYIFAGLVVLCLMLGLLIVPVEARYPNAVITHWFDGLWWAVTTITSVGYGDYYPVSKTGKLIGMVLEVSGVIAFGLMVGMISVALDEIKDKFYWQRIFERLDRIEKRLEQAEKKEEFVVKRVVENGEKEN